jgi:RNA polymerase-binding transcription factor DksA
MEYLAFFKSYAVFCQSTLAKPLKRRHDIYMKTRNGPFSSEKPIALGGAKMSDALNAKDINAHQNPMRQDILTDEIALDIIENALSRLEHGTYGFCEFCGDEMSVERLIANPVITVCKDCAGD